MKSKTKFIIQAAVIAAIYVVLTLVSSALGLSSGVIQVRFSEVLTILPIFTPAAIPGLFVGCILANLISGSIIIDVVFGSLATLLGAIFTRILKKHRMLATLPPVLANATIVPFILVCGYGITGSYWYFVMTVGLGEIISCCILGGLFITALCRFEKHIFK
ncbi:MAG: QueT transporter family protein [Clostridia bacterium]|nr:QueT transporter family protein [Clostridia bacterium]